MPKVDVCALFLLDETKRHGAIRVEKGSSRLGDMFQEFLERGDCILIFSFDNGTEFGIAPEIANWQVVTHAFGEPGIFDQIKWEP